MGIEPTLFRNSALNCHLNRSVTTAAWWKNFRLQRTRSPSGASYTFPARLSRFLSIWRTFWTYFRHCHIKYNNIGTKSFILIFLTNLSLLLVLSWSQYSCISDWRGVYTRSWICINEACVLHEKTHVFFGALLVNSPRIQLAVAGAHWDYFTCHCLSLIHSGVYMTIRWKIRCGKCVHGVQSTCGLVLSKSWPRPSQCFSHLPNISGLLCLLLSLDSIEPKTS